MGQIKQTGTVLVTGGNRGIGKAIALQLAGSGYDVVITYNSGSDEAEQTVKEIQELHVQSEALMIDLSRKDEIPSFITQLKESNPSLFAIVNNAGIYTGNTLSNTTNDDWEKVISLNLSAPFYLARELASSIVEGGSIVNISSVYGLVTDPWGYGYQASKAGLIHITQALAKELAPRVRVNCVAPGYIRTDINKEARENVNFRAKVEKMTPMGRWGEVEDVARVVEFLINPANSFITGQTFVVDGGISL